MKIFIGVPTPEYTHHLFSQSLIHLITHSLSAIKGLEIYYQPQEGNRTDRNRNHLLKEAMKTDFDYLLWLDSDMVFPHDLIEKYLKAFETSNCDVLGCLYFKRKPPYDPVGYIDYGKQKGKYRAIDPNSIDKDEVLEVKALGYGGMMIARRVFDAMGEDMWTRYGNNFHLPDPQDEEYQTHDMYFCEKAKSYGFSVYLHTGVQPKHIGTIEIGIEDWKREHAVVKDGKSVTIIMPTIHPEMAVKTAKILKERAGYPHKMIVVEDKDKMGYVAICNMVVRDNPSDYYVYLTDDIFPSRNWLLDSMDTILEKDCGLLGYNDGKWEGSIATCGLVRHEWMVKNYEGKMFFPEYFGHYNDTELTIFAMNDKTYCYNPNICLTEIDYEKDQKKVHEGDKALFAKRKESLFDGKVTDEVLVNNFS